MKNHPAYTTRVRIVRKERGFTLLRLANALKTTPQTVQRLETDSMTMSMDWLHRIAKVLRVSPASLLTGEEQPAPEDAIVELMLAELMRTRRYPSEQGQLTFLEASGRLATMLLEADQRPWQDVTRAAATVAACAIRIALDGEPGQVAQPPLALVREAG